VQSVLHFKQVELAQHLAYLEALLSMELVDQVVAEKVVGQPLHS
jgi:hypothetical protein